MKLTNYINSSILIVLILCVICFNSFKSISTQLHTILPNSEKKELLEEFNKFKSLKKVFLLVEGLDKESLKKIRNIEKEILKIEGLTRKKTKVNKELKKYTNEYKIFIKSFNKENLKSLNIETKLQEIKSTIINSDFSYFIDKQDPLEILKKNINNQTIDLKNNHLIIKNYAYLSIFNMDSSINSIEQYENIYDSIQSIIVSNKEIKVFSPIFYFVENSRIIKNDVNKIILLSTIVLLFLYLIILRDLKLLVNTLITLASSILLALLLSSLLFKELSIFVLVFGISISTVAIDYMFHHYVHKYYEEKKSFNKDVFLGMITTVGAFFIISFISFDLIKQICYFAIISLVFSYVQFAFLYPKIGFIQKEHLLTEYKVLSKINPSIMIIIALAISIISITQFKFDSNLKNLDINNTKLMQIEQSFNEKLNLQQNIPILIKATSIDDLIKNARLLKKQYPNAHIPLAVLIDEKEFLNKKEFVENINIDSIKSELNQKAQSLKFKNDFFNQAYIYDIPTPKYTKEKIESFGLEIVKFKNYFISYANVEKNKIDELSSYSFVENLSIKTMFEENLISIYKDLILFGFCTIIFIIIMIFLSSKRNYLIPLCYIIFPLSIILSLSFFISFNILHLFMLFIILAISIDFGIYMSSKELNKESYKAILYSLLSTFAGFGVLIFSKINALYSLGIIATVGIVSIILLLIILKRPVNDDKSI